jgi:hypothetical protein
MLTEKQKNNIRFMLIWISVLLMMASTLTSCSSSKVAYTPSKVKSNKLIVCNHLGCYAKRN